MALLGCAGGEPPIDTEGPDSAPPAEDTGFCAGVPVVDYDNFGRGFITQHCQGCHASTSLTRHGAPEEVTFDTVDEVWAWAERILARGAGEAPTMPPQGGVEADDRTRLEWWLRCREPGS